MEMEICLKEQLTEHEESESFEKLVIKEKFDGVTRVEVIVSKEMLQKEENGERKIQGRGINKVLEWNENGNDYGHGNVKKKNLEKQSLTQNSSITSAKESMNDDDERRKSHVDCFATELQELIVDNAPHSDGNRDAVSQLHILKRGEKLPSLYEATEQEEPFMHKKMQQYRFVDGLDLSLKLSHSPNIFRNMNCIVKEGKRFISFANNNESKENLLVEAPLFVSRPCSILSWARPEYRTEIGSPKLGSSMSSHRLFEGGDDTGPLGNVSVEYLKGLGDGCAWDYPPSDSSDFISGFPAGVRSALSQNLGLEADSTVQMQAVSGMRNPQAHGATCMYECVPKLEKSEEVDSVTEVEQSEKSKDQRSILNTLPSISKNSGYAALDLLVRAIQVSTGYLLGDEENDFPECLPKEYVGKNSLHDSQFSARDSTYAVVKKKVLRRARCAFKKSVVQESVVYDTPKRGRKRPTFEQDMENEGIKVKLSASGAQSAREKKGPLTRSKNGRSQTLPAKFCDSVLQYSKRESSRQLKVSQKTG